MDKPPRLWVAAARDARVLVPAVARESAAAASPLALHLSCCCQGAELAGPWMLRAGLRVPLPNEVPASELARRRWIGSAHVRWLRHMGLAGVQRYEGPFLPHWASFGARLDGDVLVNGRKITSVMELRRPGGALLVASTLLRAPPWPLLCRALGRAEAEVAALEAASVAAADCVQGEVDALAWAASLRTVLHLSLRLRELQEDGCGDH